MNMAEFFLGKTNNSGRDQFYYYENNELLAIRKNDWKYHIENGQLFNLKEDIAEKKNLADEYPQIIRELKETGISFDKALMRRPIGVFNE